jgi:hypothetical protein
MNYILDVFIAYIPVLVGALIVLIIGLIISTILGRFAERLFYYTKIDPYAEKVGLKHELEILGLRFSFAKLVGWAIKWFFIIATLIIVVDSLHITQITIFLQDIALYIPNVIIAIIILGIGLVLGRIINSAVRKAAGLGGLSNLTIAFLSGLAKWSIYFFSISAALIQLRVATSLILIFFGGLMAMVALVGGLAFGLGGKNKAEKILDSLELEIKGKKMGEISRKDDLL